MIPWRCSQQNLDYGEVFGTHNLVFFKQINCEEQNKRKEGRKLKLIAMFGLYLGPDFNK